MRELLVIFSVCLPLLIVAAAPTPKSGSGVSVVPEPLCLLQAKGAPFLLSNKTQLLATTPQANNSALYLKEYIKRYYYIEVEIVNDKNKANSKDVIELLVRELEAPKEFKERELATGELKKEGAYILKSSNKRVVLEGANPQGLFYAVQSQIQLLPTNSQDYHKLSIPQVTILDAPRFGYRGMHLDVVRHIYPVEYIKQYLDYLALHKINYFHWHLTDDQGWRIESKSHPKLNEIGSWRAGTIIGLFPGTGVDSTRYGGYYTIAQIKEIIDYASKRYITIIPEIDVPGHSMAILATYPQFSTTPHIPKEPAITWGIFNRQNNVLAPSDSLFSFLSDIFNELMDLFPGPYIHIGADECAKKWWEESEETKEYMAKHGLKTFNDLQREFASKIGSVIKARGRQFIGWDEMLDDGLVEGAIVMSWRNAQNGYKAAELGHKTILAPMQHSYFNIAQKSNEDTLCHNQWLLTLYDAYNFEPLPNTLSPEAAANIMGGQGCMWTEYYPHRQRLEYALFPRMSAMAELYWSSPQKRDWNNFLSKLPALFQRYTLWGANYYKGPQFQPIDKPSEITN